MDIRRSYQNPNGIKSPSLSAEKIRTGLSTLPLEIRTTVYSHFLEDTSWYDSIAPLCYQPSLNDLFYTQILQNLSYQWNWPKSTSYHWNSSISRSVLREETGPVFDPRISLLGPDFSEEFLDLYFRVNEVTLRVVQYQSHTNFGIAPVERVAARLWNFRIHIEFGPEALKITTGPTRASGTLQASDTGFEARPKTEDSQNPDNMQAMVWAGV